MTRTVVRALLLAGAVLAAIGIGCAQARFDVDSVKQNTQKGQGRLRYNPSGIDFADVPLTWVIGEAYGVPFSRVSSPDSRIRDLLQSGMYFFDITAKAEHEVSRDQIRSMLQTLLSDRFKLMLHRDSKIEAVYNLVVGKSGAKLQPSAAEGEPSAAMGFDGFVFHNMEMARFAGILSMYMDRPVVDMTGLTGFYDFSLKLETTAAGAEAKLALRDWFTSSLFSDIQKQLGLRLAADKASLDNLVVDHVEKPSEN